MENEADNSKETLFTPDGSTTGSDTGDPTGLRDDPEDVPATDAPDDATEPDLDASPF